MYKNLILFVSVLLLSVVSTSQALVVGDFEGGLDGWAPSGDAVLTLSDIGATTGTGSLMIEAPGSWQMLALLDIKSLRSVLAVDGAAVSADVTAFAEDMETDWMNMEMIINGQNNDDNGANNNIGWQSLGGVDIVRDGTPHTLTWQLPADLSAKIAGTDDSIAWFELFIVTNNGATNTKIYIDNIQLIGAEPEPEPEPAGPKIIFVSFHGADDAPSAAAAAVGFTEASDKGYTDVLKANGYDVERYITTSTPDPDVLNAADLVIISRAVASSGYQNDGATAWNNISAPMMIMGGYVLRSSRMGYTNGNDMPDTTGNIRLAVADPFHPIFAGIPLTDGVMDNPYAAGAVPLPTDPNIISRGISINNNTPNAEGTLLATISEASADAGPAGGMVIAEWPAGATLTHDGGAGTDVLGGPRLVFLTGSREPDGVTGGDAAGLYDLYPDGERMFLNAVRYMLNLGNPKIIWVTDAYDDNADGIPDDVEWPELLTEAGYNVDYRYNAFGDGYWRILDDDKIAALNAADLIIVSRNSDSSSYNNDDEVAQWNAITAPLILCSTHIVRNIRWNWVNSETIESLTPSMVLADGSEIPGINPDVGQASFINADPGNGLVLATGDGLPWIITWDAGVEFYDGAGQIAGGPRMFFVAGTQEDTAVGFPGRGEMNLYPEALAVFMDSVKMMIPVKPVDPGTEGLVAHYAFENDANDSSGNGLNGTIIGDPNFVEGVVGMALDLNGDDYVDCGGVTEFSFVDAMTLSTWVNIRSVTTAWMAIAAKGENAWRLAVSNETTALEYAFSGGTRGWQAATTATELAFDEWYHVAATYDIAVGATVYINGVADASNPDAGGIDVNQFPLLIGENPEALGRMFDGMIDELMIYNRALSQEEVLFLAGQ